MQIELDPGNPEAQVSRQFLQQDAQDTWEGQLEAATFSLRLLPTDVKANQMAGVELGLLGKFERSLEYLEYVLGKDPLCSGCLRTYMMTLMTMGDYAAAEDAAKRYLAVTGGAGTYTLGFIQLLRGDAETALATMESSGTFPFVILQGRTIANWTLGWTEEYELALAELEASVNDEAYANLRVRPDDFLAGAYAWVGRENDALDILEELIDPPSSWGPHRWNVDPIFNSLHDDPRWLALLEKERVSPQHIESYKLDERFPGPGKVPTY